MPQEQSQCCQEAQRNLVLIHGSQLKAAARRHAAVLVRAHASRAPTPHWWTDADPRVEVTEVGDGCSCYYHAEIRLGETVWTVVERQGHHFPHLDWQPMVDVATGDIFAWPVYDGVSVVRGCLPGPGSMEDLADLCRAVGFPSACTVGTLGPLRRAASLASVLPGVIVPGLFGHVYEPA